MNHYSIIDGVVTSSTTLCTTSQLSREVGNVPDPLRNGRDFLTLMARDYQWFDPRNKQEAQQHLHGVKLAQRHGLTHQVRQHALACYRWLTKDAADGTAQLLATRLHHQSHYYYRPDDLSLGKTSFTVPVSGERAPVTSPPVRTEWVYQPVHAFVHLIPLPALEAMSLLAELQLQPLAYWVADKVTVQSTERLRVDPLLYAQYGRWFVSIAQWL